MHELPEYLVFSLLISSFKILFIPTYRSTDFEVHRNWLAITHSKPITDWYTESTSQWTLDYPPFFAYFEYVLGMFASFFDPAMLELNNLNYASHYTVVFQRLSVIVTDMLLFFSVYDYCQNNLLSHHQPSKLSLKKQTIVILLTSNFGLIIIDHIHFQYNGFLFGLLLLSLSKISQGCILEGSLWFSTLVYFKHIYIYIAPAYAIYLLRCSCFQSKQDGSVDWHSFSPARLFIIGMVPLSISTLAFLPFVTSNRMLHLLQRLFPFKRGLCHAYWAPNFWAIYNCLDKAFTLAGRALGYQVASSSSMTGGLVQESNHVVLPSIAPLLTFALTAVGMLPALVCIWRRPGGTAGFLRLVTACAYSSFMFGWHVHEKAALLITFPAVLNSVENPVYARHTFFILTTAHFSLFPLIFTYPEMLILHCLMLAFTILSFCQFQALICDEGAAKVVSPFEAIYLLLMIPFELYTQVHSIFFPNLPFLPLMLRSLYCALGFAYSFVSFNFLMWQEKEIWVSFQKNARGNLQN